MYTASHRGTGRLSDLSPNVPARILHVAPTPFFSDRGCHIRIRGIVRALNDHGSKNLVCTYPIGRDDESVETVRTLPVPGYRKTAAGPSVFKLIVDPLLVLTTARHIVKFRPDVLHCHLHEGVLVGWLAKYLALKPGLQIGFDVQGGLVSELSSYGHLKLSLTRRLIRAIEAFVIARADSYFCSSMASVNLFEKEFGVDERDLHHVPDGADVDASALAERPAPPSPIALYAGGLTKSKGIEQLQEVLKLSAERKLPVTFRIVGYPTEALAAFIRQHNLDNCELLGRVPFERLPELMADATVALEPKSGTTSEASGKLLNYMAASLPVVCFDTDNNRSMLGDHGYYAEATASHFVEQLAAVLADEGAARLRGKEGRERVQRTFSWRASGETILQSYARLLSG